jgi:hypothetical protein
MEFAKYKAILSMPMEIQRTIMSTDAFLRRRPRIELD